MRILLASNVYPPNVIGGAEIIAHAQAKTLQAQGHEVRVFAGEVEAFGRHHEVRSDLWESIPVDRVSMLPRDFDPSYVNFTGPDIEAHFEHLVERFRPEVFHAHNLTGLSVGLLRLAKRAGVIVVVTLHDHWGFCFKNTLLKRRERVCQDYSRCAECMATVDDGAERGIPIRVRNDFLALMLSQADALVTPSRYLADTYVRAGFPRGLFHVIPNGIDVERFRKVQPRRSDEELHLSYVGGLYFHKGVATLVEAVGALPEDAPVRINIVGSGDQRTRCERIVERNGRSEQVRFWGRIDNERIEEVYAETDIFVLPSIWPENHPVSITEAMACGIPAIVSDLGGNPELVEDGVTGKLFRAGDARDLARCIRFFLRHPDRVQRYGEAARKRIEDHTFVAQVRQLVDLYASVETERSALTGGERLVVCYGSAFNHDCARIMEKLPATDGWRFVLREWIDREMSRSAWLHWVCDGSTSAVDLLTDALEAPLLVTIHNDSLLQRLCTDHRALFYCDAPQALDCIERLKHDASLYRSLLSGAAEGSVWSTTRGGIAGGAARTG